MIKTIEQLENDDCRFPVGNSTKTPYHFCGKNRLYGSYCETHYIQAHRLNYKTSLRREKETAERLRMLRNKNQKKVG